MEEIAALDELERVAQNLLREVDSSAVVLLKGNLAAGKTTLVSKIVQILGEGAATSPTFSLQQSYGERVFHYDFYRVSFDEILSLGLVEELEKEGLHFIEWADDALKELLIDAGFKLFELDIDILNESSRKYRLKALYA